MTRKIRSLATAGILFVAMSLATISHAATIYLQPAKSQGMDRWFGSVYQKTSQNDWQLRVGGWGDEYDTVLRFNLSSAPQVANKAILWIYVFPEGDGFTALNWNFISSQWQSDTIGWDNRPSYANWGNTPAPIQTGWYGIDVTFVYNTYWRRGLPTAQSLLNYGLLVRPTPAPANNRYTSAFSSNNPVDDYRRPVLQVDYTQLPNEQERDMIRLRWPLSTAKPSPDINCTQRLIFECLSPLKCDDGITQKVHNGVDYSASSGASV